MKWFIVLAALLVATPAAAAESVVSYHLAQTYVFGGTGGWDYLTYDSDSHRLFVSQATHVMVVDPRTGSIAGDVPRIPGRATALRSLPISGKGFTSNGTDGTVTVFSLSTLATIATIQTGAKNPDGIAYDPATSRVFTFNGENDATVIDARTNAVVATIPLGGRPEFPAVDGRGMVYDNVASTSEIVAIDARSAKITARFPLGSCQHRSGL